MNDDPAEFEIRAAPDRLPGLLFVAVAEPKTSKNRLHLDFRPDDRDAEEKEALVLARIGLTILVGTQQIEEKVDRKRLDTLLSEYQRWLEVRRLGEV